MSNQYTFVAALFLCLSFVFACHQPQTQNPAVDQEASGASAEERFRPLVIELEVGKQPVAAYQIELTIVSGNAEIVGVEGGTAPGFTEPPFYDPAALSGGRIIVASFNPEVYLTTGRHRVAVIHMFESGPAPVYRLDVMTAGDQQGRPVPVSAVLVDDEIRSSAEEK